MQSYPNAKLKNGIPLQGLNSGPSQPKLVNVTNGLQGDSMIWLGNLTVPICTYNVVLLTA